MKPFYITTPIYYVNAKPHIGHVYSTLIADVINRYNKLLKKDTYFLTGTDEHGLKIQQASEKNNLSPKEFTDKISNNFKETFNKMGFEYDRFIRTTDEDHINEVKKLWNIMYEKGDIYLGEYTGWYSISDETFVPDNMVIDYEDKKTGNIYKIYKETNNKVEKITEKNYMFKLSKYRNKIIEYINNNNPILPTFRQNEILKFLENDINDLSVSRKKSISNWGIEVPNDSEHIIYVWLDALTNYKTATNFNENIFPANIHIVGKDILKFHAVYWISFLMSCELPLPSKIVSHGWWLNDNVKMSKSLNNVINPLDIVEKYGLDEFRYFLLRVSSLESDSNFSELKIKTIITELANTLGNLACRCLSKKLNPSEYLPNHPNLSNLNDIDIISNLNNSIELCKKYMEIPSLNEYINTIYEYCQDVNKYIQINEPWKLIKSDINRFNEVRYIMIESLRIITLLLSPILIEKTNIILEYLNLGIYDSTLEFGYFSDKNKIKFDIKPLFNKI
jgi:methionyl-tRNA synthetase